MKVLSSVVLGVGLLLPGALVSAADAPAAGGAKATSSSGANKAAGTKGEKAAAEKAPAAPAVPLEVDGVAFGMGAEDVAKLYDRWWDKQFVPRYQKANPGPKTKELDFDLAEKKKVLRRVANFDGRSTSFDKSEFHEEFVHGNAETMTSSKVSRRPAADPKDPKETKATGYTRRFFFFHDKLWKVYDEYKLGEASPFGADFKEATLRVESTLGKGAKKTRGPQSEHENVTYDAGDQRVRVVKLPSDRIAIVRSDNALAKEVLDGRTQLAKSAESSDLDDDIQAVIR